jgi:hypothetical protein
MSQTIYRKNKIVDRPTIINQRPDPINPPLVVKETMIVAKKVTNMIAIKPSDIYQTHLPKAIVARRDIFLPIKAQIKNDNPPAAKINSK